MLTAVLVPSGACADAVIHESTISSPARARRPTAFNLLSPAIADLLNRRSRLRPHGRAEEGRDAVRAPQAHLKARRLRARRPTGARDESLLAATAQNLRGIAYGNVRFPSAEMPAS